MRNVTPEQVAMVEQRRRKERIVEQTKSGSRIRSTGDLSDRLCCNRVGLKRRRHW